MQIYFSMSVMDPTQSAFLNKRLGAVAAAGHGGLHLLVSHRAF